MDLQKEREALIAEIERFKEEAMKSYVVSCWAESYTNTDPFGYVILENENNKVWWLKTQAYQLWEMWQAAKAHQAEKLKGCVVVPKDQTEDWYLDDNANMWITEPDEWLCDLYVGEVQSVEHKEYLITKSDTLYAAIVWDDENQDSGTWEFFKTEEEAEKAAAHCKAMLEAARGGNE